MDQELKLTPKQKEEAKDCLFKLLKENGTYDELYVKQMVSPDRVADCAQQGRWSSLRATIPSQEGEPKPCANCVLREED